MTDVRVRFAPSPTGTLHVGGARTALFNWLYARHCGGTFVLRIEDTDRERSTEESVGAIFDSFRWLVLDWDEGPDVGGDYGPYFQSQRHELYAKAADQLLADRKAYRCYCTPEELDSRRNERLARGESTSYDGRCRDEIGKPARAEPFVVRLATPARGEIAWDDLVRGTISFQAETLEDFVLLRADGSTMYNFAAVVDDSGMRITDILRGDDHISNTPKQILLYQALGLELPRFGHVPMILGPDGTRLSKRHGATSVTAYAEQGILADALVNFLALLGWSYDDSTELFTREELIKVFSIQRLGKTPSIFNVEKLDWMNGVYMMKLPIEEKIEIARGYLQKQKLADRILGEDWLRMLIEALGDRFQKPDDIAKYADYLFADAVEAEPEALERAAKFPEGRELLPELANRFEALGSYEHDAIESCLRALATEKGRKAGDLIHPSRVALTGKAHGPSIFDVMLLLGRERTVRRLRAFVGV